MTSKNSTIAQSNGSTLLKFLLTTQHKVPFRNTCEAQTENQKENGKCTNVTNRRSSVNALSQTRESPAKTTHVGLSIGKGDKLKLWRQEKPGDEV